MMHLNGVLYLSLPIHPDVLLLIKSDKDILDLIGSNKISVDQIDQATLYLKKEKRGRKKKILTECPQFTKDKIQTSKAEKAIFAWFYWIKLENVNIPQMTKRKLISNALNWSGKKLDVQITKLNAFRKDPDMVVIVTNTSIILDSVSGIKKAQFAHRLGLDPLGDYLHYEPPTIYK